MVSTITRLREQQQRQRQFSRQRQLRINKQLQQESLRKGVSVSELQRQKDVAAQGRQIEKATQEALKEREQELKERSLKFEKASDKLQKNIDNLKQKKYYYGLTRSDSIKLQTLIYEKKALGNILKNENISFEQAQKISASEGYRREKEERAARRRDVMGESEAKFRTSARKEYAEFAAAGFPVTAYLGDPQAEKTIRDLEAKGIKLTETAKENIRKIARGEKVFTTGKPIELPKFTPTAPTTREIITGIWNAPRITTPTSIVSKVFIPSVKKIDLPPDFQMLSSEEDFAGSGSGGGAAGGSAGGIDFSGSGGLDIGGSGKVEPHFVSEKTGMGFTPTKEDKTDLIGFAVSPSFTQFSDILGRTSGYLSTKTREKEGTALANIYGLGGFGIRGLEVFSDIGAFGESLISKPISTIMVTGKGLKETAKFGYGRIASGEMFPEIGAKLYSEPEMVFGQAAGEIGSGLLLGAGASKFLGTTTRTATKLSPKYRPVSYGVETLDDVKYFEKLGGVSAEFETGITGKLGTIKRIPTTKGKVDIDIAGSIGSETLPTMTLREQAQLAGKKVTAVSAQADFPKQFFIEPLEKTFWVDPFGRIRPSRLGLEQKGAGVLDILAGDVTLLRPKPKIFVFPETKIADFPKNLQSVANKLKSGQSLTPSEVQRLVKFQQTPTGEFKPIGFLSTEPEIILPAGERLINVKRAGTTIIDKRRVGIYELDIEGGLKKPVSQNFDDVMLGKRKPFTQEDFLKQMSESRRISQTPYVSPYGLGVGVSSLFLGTSKNLSAISGTSKQLSNITGSVDLSKPSKPISPISPPSKKISGFPDITKTTINYLSPTISPTPKGYGGVSPFSYLSTIKPPIPTILRRKSKDRKYKEKPSNIGYNVQLLRETRIKKKRGEPETKVRGKSEKINPKPLSKEDALNLASYGSDNTLNRQFRIVRAKGKPQLPTIKVPPNYWKLYGYKFRDYKIKQDVRKPFREPTRFIEKKAYVGDTAGEMRRLSSAKWTAQQKQKARQQQVQQQKFNQLFNFPQFQQNRKVKKTRKTANKMNKIAGFDKRLGSLLI